MTLYDVIFSYSHWRYLHHCCIFHRGGRNKEIISLHYRPTESLHFMQYDLDVRIWFSVNKFQKAWNEAEHYTSRGSQTCKSRTLEGNGRLYWGRPSTLRVQIMRRVSPTNMKVVPSTEIVYIYIPSSQFFIHVWYTRFLFNISICIYKWTQKQARITSIWN